MKFLLVPFTAITWYFIIHFAFWLSFNGAIFIINQSWIVIFIVFLFMFGIVTFIATSLPNIISALIKSIYNNNKTVNIIHAVFGLIAVLWFLINLFNDQPRMIIQENWEYNKAKIIVLFFPLAGLFIGLLYTSVSMIFDKKN